MKKILKKFQQLLFFGAGVVVGLELSNVFRPSLRSRILYRLMGLFHQPVMPVELDDLRSYLVRLQKFVPPPLKIDPNPVDANGIPCEWVLPEKAISTQVVFYLHGGGYVTKMPVLHRNFLYRMAQESQTQFLMVDYRLAPEHPFPAALEDALVAYDWLLHQGWDSQKIIIAGDSAGGGLTLATLLALRDMGKPLPVGAILMSPWTDLTGSGESITRLQDLDVMLTWENLQDSALDYAGSEPLSHPWISPLFADFHGLPDSLILVGGREILMDDSTRLAQRMTEDGVEVDMVIEPYMGHVYPATGPAIPEAQRAIEKIADFIKKC
jgi:acetyl esterase/lipase